MMRKKTSTAASRTLGGFDSTFDRVNALTNMITMYANAHAHAPRPAPFRFPRHVTGAARIGVGGEGCEYFSSWSYWEHEVRLAEGPYAVGRGDAY